MPQTPWIHSDELRIEVTEFRPRYQFGDVLRGRIIYSGRKEGRSNHFKLVLFGRTRSKFVSASSVSSVMILSSRYRAVPATAQLIVAI